MSNVDTSFAFPSTEPYQHPVFNQGLTKREYFAAMAMQSIIRQHPLLPIAGSANRFATEAATQATYYADALLAEMAKPTVG